MDSVIGKIRNLDVYPKINDDFYSRTISGGVITMASSIIMLLLFLSELRFYLHEVTETKLVVDTSRGETLPINFDAMDVSGEEHLDVIERPLQRHGGRLEHNETYCGSCYGAEAGDDDFCNNCEEVREAYRRKGWALSNPDAIDQ